MSHIFSAPSPPPPPPAAAPVAPAPVFAPINQGGPGAVRQQRQSVNGIGYGSGAASTILGGGSQNNSLGSG